MADEFMKRKIGEADMLQEVDFFDERKPKFFSEKKEQAFRKRKNEVSPQEAIATLNFAIRKATSDGAKRTTEALIKIRTDYMRTLENFEGDFQDKKFKPVLTSSKRRYS